MNSHVEHEDGFSDAPFDDSADDLLSFASARLAFVAIVVVLLALAAGLTAIPGCAVLAGAAAGGATGYVAGHEAAKHE